MKKAVGITTGVVVVAVAGWLGATWYTGKRIEAEAPAQVTRLNKELAQALAGTGHGLSFEQISYDRHFFTTDVRYVVKLSEPADDDTLPENLLEIAGKIEHGPFAKGALARGHWLPKLAFVHTELAENEFIKPVLELTQGASPVTSDTIFAYNGDAEITSSIVPIEFAKDEQSIKFSGAQMQGTYTRATQHIVGSSTMGKLFLHINDEDETVQIDIDGLSMEIDTRAGKWGLGVGTSGMKIDRMAFDAKPRALDAATPGQAPEEHGSNVVIKKLSYTGSLGETGDMLHGAADYKIGQVLVNGNDFGHGSVSIKVDRVDGPASKALTDFYNELLSESSDDTVASSPNEARVTEATNQLIKLLAAKPTLRIEPVIWETAKGQSRLDLAVDLTKPEGLNPGQALPSDYRQLVQQAIALIDLKIKLSKPMMQDVLAQYLQNEGEDAAVAADEAAGQIDSLGGLAEMFGIAKVQGEDLVGTFRYAEGKADLNGEEFPVEDLFENLLGGLGSDDEEMVGDDNAMLETLDPTVIGEIIESMGYDYQLGATDDGAPVVKVDGSDEGAESITIAFNDCETSSACSDMSLRATIKTPHAVSMRALNDWNQENRMARAYWDADKKVAVLEMDVNAYGGIGASNVQYSLAVFLASVTDFADTMNAAADKKS
ncbi:DUF945 family protein [Bordetella sp. 15P40C-2]|uniref:DUF945 family protein n=1 Tax=Bordetella sp. 15P40C-2 TaxID=2572246 RepID=UPI00132C7CCA|nr:DUF945 family protein [Bordetella sp. 15P40C-2]MVW70240.1 DUF945 family protein [Bordetella sp. 15P40C-2]